MSRTRRTSHHAEAGIALLAVLVILLVVAAWSTSFIWLMNQQQTRAGNRLRSAAALTVAEAGVHRALSILESMAPDGQASGRTWRPAAHTEILPSGLGEGRLTLSLNDRAGGAIVVTSTGEVAGAVHRLRARVYLASPALLTALYGTGVVRFASPPAAALIIPYGAGIGDRPWIHVAAGQGIWFATTEISINDPGLTFDVGLGPMEAPDGRDGATRPARPGPVRLLLGRGAEVTLGPGGQRVDLQQLRVMGVHVEGVVIHSETLPPVPGVDGAYYQGLAAANIANAALNEAAGQYFGDAELIRKRDSLYTYEEFEQVRSFLRTQQQPAPLRGVVYVRGGVSLLEAQRLQIADGALVTEGTVHVVRGASMEIVHSAATRALPGLILLGTGGLVVSGESRLRVHGLVYANRAFDVSDGARVDIVGAVLGNDPRLSFRNFGASIVIRYDPAVLGTPGLHVPVDAPVVAWVAAWEEVP